MLFSFAVDHNATSEFCSRMTDVFCWNQSRTQTTSSPSIRTGHKQIQMMMELVNPSREALLTRVLTSSMLSARLSQLSFHLNGIIKIMLISKTFVDSAVNHKNSYCLFIVVAIIVIVVLIIVVYFD